MKIIKIPKDKVRGIGDNSSDEFGTWAAAALTDAIAYTAKIIKKNAKLEDILNKAIYGKNNLQRGVALSEAKKINASVIKDAKVFEPILNGINNRENIHEGKLKHHKLNMCDKAGRFGDWIANQTGGKEFAREVDEALSKADEEDDQLEFDFDEN
jgi:hypothetical protein|tara:strand:- start:745 stop:1209 length:465 start_codon:yes stop_codon:yes gene_type:complete